MSTPRLSDRGSGSGADLLDPRRDERWAAFVTESRASIFHHPEWLRLLHRTYGYEAAACCVSEGGRVCAGLPVARVSSALTGRRLVALPFSDVCEPAALPAAPEGSRSRLLVAVAELGARMGLDVEIRTAVEDLPGGRPAGAFLHHRLSLAPDAERIERRVISSAARRGIAKARREGLIAERRTDAWGLAQFYRLHLRTRRRQGVPIQPKRFIMGLEALFRSGLGFVVVVRADRRVIAAAVFLTCNGVMTYKYGASDERHLAARPNNLLFIHAIAWGCANGLHTLDFGRTDLDNPGLAAFKRAWGAEERQLSYTSTAQRAHDIGSGLPARVLRASIRRGPTALCRVTGEVLYRHLG